MLRQMVWSWTNFSEERKIAFHDTEFIDYITISGNNDSEGMKDYYTKLVAMYEKHNYDVARGLVESMLYMDKLYSKNSFWSFERQINMLPMSIKDKYLNKINMLILFS